MASPNTIARNEKLKDLVPKLVPYIEGKPNEMKRNKRILKGMHKGNTYGKRNYAKQLLKD